MGTWERGDGVVELPDGRRVRGRGLRSGPPGPDDVPELGVYLTGTPPPATVWESRWVRWPDFALPRSTPDAVAVLREAYDRAPDERVEIACGGGTGRTGTALALLAVWGGVRPDDAVAWVRAHYRPRAVETPWQRRWVRRSGARTVA
ncbi:protein phosphatase [Cellulosimicrobium cellulans]|uniref:phosphatase domain-containing protein n=1 Tax=Cellulosimicrobium cellulans TaxID=1710 RepID=UPI001963D27F|nr:protein-tyrosine phosphatase family protein [Cellulosimicrobium cellulans]MBN0038824.1 protein phosphatase [Cellulosimicrobium cellulans]